ncbi:MAG: hypothetical protein LBN36_06855 [Clostridiales Family XIII bacterium]|jgi:hypothetical protein|nr:hypothetical protein [Clostridiales Family XIII bacterium]
MPRFQTKNTAALESEVTSYLNALPAETVNIYQIWYEKLGAYGVPASADIEAIKTVLAKQPDWEDAGVLPNEKYGPLPSYRRITGPKDTVDEKSGRIRVQHMFKVGSRYQAPDGKVYQIALAEVYNLRGFEVVDGHLDGPMIKINPTSDLAKSLVEIK